MEIPQYVSRSAPNASILSSNVPNADLEGVKNLTSALQTSISDIGTARDEVGANKAIADYNTQLVQMKADFANTATLDNIDIKSNEFNQKSMSLMGEVMQKHGVSYKKSNEMTSRLQATYQPENLQFTLSIAKDVKTKALADQDQNYDNQVGQLFSSASAAQLKGSTGTEMLDQQMLQVDQQIDMQQKSGMLTASQVEYAKTLKKMQISNYFWGRMLKVDPNGVYDMVTQNSKKVVLDQAELYRKASQTGGYQTIYKAKDPNFKTYQHDLYSLDAATKQRLNLQKVMIGKGESFNSTAYDLGAIYNESKASGESFKNLLKDPTILSKYATPFSPYFSTNSVYYNKETQDFAGSYKNGVYIPANLTPGSKYFNPSLKFTSMETLGAVQSAYGTYVSETAKAKKQDQMMQYLPQLRQAQQALEADNLTGVPTNVLYPTSNNKVLPGDPYASLPAPSSAGDKSMIISMIKQEAKAKGIPTAYAMALFAKESGFRTNARGGSGEYGLGQLMPATAQSLGVKNPWSEIENIRASLDYYSNMYRNNGKNPELAYAGYNGGTGNLKHYKNGRANAGYKNNVNGYMKLVRKYEQEYGTI